MTSFQRSQNTKANQYKGSLELYSPVNIPFDDSEYKHDITQQTSMMMPNYRNKMWRICISVCVFNLFSTALYIQRRHFCKKCIQSPPILRFREHDHSWKFKIVQITDIHLGEEPTTDWGPANDQKTFRLLKNILMIEKPDLIVLSGDQITANYSLPNATTYYQILGDFLSQFNTPWATTFGNHDDLDYSARPPADYYPQNKLPSGKYPPKYSRSDLLEVDQKHHFSLTKGGISNVTGTTNYKLNILLRDHVAAQIFMFDSGGGSLPERIAKSQLDWFQREFSISQHPAVAFQHIPSSAHTYHESCSGFQGEGIDALQFDAGIVPALTRTKRFAFLAVGHNHGNDYCCPYNNTMLHVCFGRHSGYGGYGRWDRGVRVYELFFENGSSNNMKWNSWIRLESGLKILS